MGSAYEVELVLLEELADNVGAEGVGNPSVVHPPSVKVLGGIGPEEIAQQPGVGDVGGALQIPNLIKVLQVRRETAVHAEDLVVNQGRHRKAVEAVDEGPPQPHAESPLAFIVKPVYAVDRRALVVAPQQEEVLWVFDLVRQEQAYCLQALLPSVHVVPQEEVIRLRGEPAALKKPQEIGVLPVYVSCIRSGSDVRLQSPSFDRELLPNPNNYFFSINSSPMIPVGGE